jgi:hypothetical protein
MPRSTASFLIGSMLCGATLLAAACTRGRDGFQDQRPPPGFTDAEPPDTCRGVRCSRDLKAVLRGCTDEVVEECGSGTGCGNGTCVDACLSAELSKGSLGCSFWTIPPTTDPHLGRGSCFAAMIANTWDRPVSLSAELGPDPLDISRSIYLPRKVGDRTTYEPVSGPLAVGDVAVVFLSQMSLPPGTKDFIPCPDGVVPAFDGDPIRHRTTLTRAFHLRADAPVTAYSMFPYGGAASHVPTATLLLPVTSWSTNYRAVSTSLVGPNARTVVQIIANEDDTDVWIAPSRNIEDGEDVGGTARGVPKMWRLSRGQALQLSQLDDLTGSPIESNKPVGLFGGAECSNIPADVASCDLTQQQIVPLSQWGSAYPLVPYRSRIGAAGAIVQERVPYSFVGAASGTVLSYDPARPTGAPETLEPGQAVSFMTDQLVVVRSQDASHPFHAAVYMTGEKFNSPDGVTLTSGDPDFVNLVPSEQFLDRYVFFADFTYPETMLTLVRRKGPNGFAQVELDCAGPIPSFHPLGSSGEYEYAWIHLTHESVPQRVGSGECGYGRHEAFSEGAFSIAVWGVGAAASYGYAGGMGSRPVNDVKAPIVR